MRTAGARSSPPRRTCRCQKLSGQTREHFHLEESEGISYRVDFQDPTFVHMELPTARTRCDVIIKRSPFISPSGDMMPCSFVPHVPGNRRNLPLEEIWRRHTSALKLDFAMIAA